MLNTIAWPYPLTTRQMSSIRYKSTALLRAFVTPAKLDNDLLEISLAGLRSVFSYSPFPGQHVYVVEKPAFGFLPISHTLSFHTSSVSFIGNIPTEEEWGNLWKAWDLVTLSMIPSEMLHQKPIDLRHKCLFYIGHIPT